MLERLIEWIKKVLRIHSPSEEWGAVSKLAAASCDTCKWSPPSSFCGKPCSHCDTNDPRTSCYQRKELPDEQ